MSKRRFDENQEKRIIELWNRGMNTSEIGKEFGCDRSTIRKLLIRNDIDTKRKKYNFQKYIHNEDFFNKIDNEEKAYVLGFILADGHINHMNKCLMITLASKDEELLIKIKDLISPQQSIKHKFQKFDKNSDKKYECVILNISSSKLIESLENMGIDNNKTNHIDIEKIIKHIPTDLQRHFIRGFFDGDGCIGIYKQTHYDKPLYNFSIIGLKNVLEYVANYFDISTIYKVKKSESCWSLECKSKDKLIEIREILYKDATIYLKRKKDIFDKI